MCSLVVHVTDVVYHFTCMWRHLTDMHIWLKGKNIYENQQSEYDQCKVIDLRQDLLIYFEFSGTLN